MKTVLVVAALVAIAFVAPTALAEIPPPCDFSPPATSIVRNCVDRAIDITENVARFVFCLAFPC